MVIIEEPVIIGNLPLILFCSKFSLSLTVGGTRPCGEAASPQVIQLYVMRQVPSQTEDRCYIICGS